jgi:predicted XRE-type DNA-binding protein
MSLDDVIEESSGNVFADLGLPDADELFAKAALALAIRRTMNERGISSGDAAIVLGVTEEEVEELTGRGSSRFRVDRLLGFLDRLGWRGQQM